MLKLLAVGAATLALAAGASSAQAAAFVFTPGTTTYTQNFDSLTANGTFANLPAGVLARESGVNANGAYVVGTGSSNTGDTYSFGVDGDRAFGGLRSENLNPLIGFGFTNNTGQIVQSFEISFMAEQWRRGRSNPGVDQLEFRYTLNNNGTLDNVTTSFDALDVRSPVGTGAAGALNGNLAQNRVALSATISGFVLENGSSFAFSFEDINIAGADDGLAIDDFTLTLGFAPAAVPEPASWAMMIGGFGLLGAATRRRSDRSVRA